MANSLTAASAPTPVEQSNQSAALPGTGNPITTGPMASPGTLNVLTGTGGGNPLMSAGGGAVPATMQAPAPSSGVPAAAPPPPAAAAPVPAAAVTAPPPVVQEEAEPLPDYVPFLSQRSSAYGWSAPISAGVDRGATNFNPLFGSRLAKAVADGEAITGERAVFNDMERSGATQAQYYADFVGRPITHEGQTLQPDPSRRGRIAARPPGLNGALGSKHQVRTDNADEMGAGVEAVDFSNVSPQVRDYVKANAGRYGLQNVRGDRPHIQLNRNIALTDDEANDVIAKLGYPNVEAFQQATGAEVDGIIGPETRGKVLAAMAKGAPVPTALADAEQKVWPTNAQGEMDTEALALDGPGADTLTDADRALEAIDEMAATGTPITPANWQSFQSDLNAGNVPWSDLPPEWRDELVSKFGKDARTRYTEAQDRLAADDRGFTVQGETQNLPEMWGEAPDDGPPDAKAPILTKGAKGPEVAGYQMMLAGLGHYQAGIDQDYGRRTEAAVKAFQAANGLKVDGKIGPMTGPAIEAAFQQKIQNPRAPARAPRPVTPSEKSERISRIGRIPVDVTPADREAWRGTVNDLDAIRIARRLGMGNSLTQLSIDASAAGNRLIAEGGGPIGNEAAVNRQAKGNRLDADIPPTENWGKPIPGSAPVLSSDLVPGGAGPGGAQTATMEERREAAKEAVRVQSAERMEELERIKEQGTVPASDRPLTPRFERLDPEAKVQEIQDVIDANQGIPEEKAIFGTDPYFDNIKGGSAADRLMQRLEEADEEPGIGIAPPDVEEPETADDGYTPTIGEVAAGVGSGALRGVEDVVGQVANALGWTVSGAASLMAREGIISKSAADEVAAAEERRRAFAEGGPATEAIVGEGADELPGYGAGRVIGQTAATAAPVLKTLQLIKAGAPAFGPIGESVGNLLTGTGGFGSKVTGGGFMGAESALLAGEDPRWGAAGGALGGLGVGLGGPAARWVADKVRGLPAPREAIQSVRTMINDVGMNIDDAIARIKADADARLFDLDPALADEARSLAATGGNKATSVLKNAIETRDSGASEALLNGLNKRLGRLDSPNDTIKRINTAIQEEFAPLDEAAKKSIATLDAKPVVEAIDNMLATTKSRELKNVLKADVRPALYDNNGHLEFEVGPLLKAREAIDRKIENPARAFPSGDIADLRTIRRGLDQVLKTVPEVRHRDMVYASGKKVEEAFEAGKQFMKTGADDVKTALSEMTPGERMAYKAGARSSVDEFVKTNPVVRGGAIVKNAENAKKFERVFGPAGQDALDFMEQEFAKKQTGNKIARGSETAASQGRSGELSRGAKTLDRLASMAGGGGALYQMTGDPMHALTGASIGYGVNRVLGGIAGRMDARHKAALAEALALQGEDAIRFLEAARTIGAVGTGNKLLSTSASTTGNAANERRRAVRERPNPLIMVPTGN
jgi:peptidoglycan hydrolase-like protein with peptidoglycan-binding domain